VLKVAQQTVTASAVGVGSNHNAAAESVEDDAGCEFANVNLSDAKLLLAQAQNDVQSAQAELARAMGVATAGTYSLADEAMPVRCPDEWSRCCRMR